MMKRLKKPKLGDLTSARRRTVNVPSAGLVKMRPLFEDGELPLLIEPAAGGVDVVSWAASEKQRLRELLDRHGGLLLRGFDVADVATFERLIDATSGGSLEYRERSSPRSQVSGNIYTSTDYPPDQEIFVHNENSYQAVFPLRIFFYCVTAATERGATPIVDCRRVYERLPEAVRRRFVERKWSYVRNFGDGFGLAWQTVFQSDDRTAVEEYCARHGIDHEWRPGGRLRTRAVRPALAVHPRTGETVWFNHATILNVSTLAAAVRQALEAEFADQDLPSNSYYGDGSPIEPETLEALRAAYRAETVRFPWREGDVLMLDNMLVAHGREPFSGARKVVVGMADPCTWESLEPSWAEQGVPA